MVRIFIVLLMVWEGLLFSVSVTSAGTRNDARAIAMVPPGQGPRSAEKDLERTVTRELNVDWLQGAIQRYLERSWAERVKTISVTVLDPSEGIPMPAGIAEFQVLPTGADDGLGRRLFHVVVAVSGKPWKTIPVLADVSAMIDTIVPTRLLRSEEIIDGGDLKTVRTRIHQLNHPFITDRDEVLGKSAARPLPPDTPLRPAFVKPPLLVKKGDRVLIEARRGGLSIHAYGITKASGQLGQTVMVANLDSGRELRAKVVAHNVVQVEF